MNELHEVASQLPSEAIAGGNTQRPSVHTDLNSSSDSSPPSRSRPGLPHLPADIINMIANEYERTCPLEECRKLGRNMSMVNREWREIGQSLVFRHVKLFSLDVYSPMVRRLLERSFFLVDHVRHLDIVHLNSALPISTTILVPMFDACVQLTKLTIRTTPRQMSEIVKAIVTSTARSSLTRIRLEYALSGSLDDFDERDFVGIAKKLNPLEVFSLVLPVELASTLPPRFPLSNPLQTQGFYLSYRGTASETALDEATSSMLSLIAPERLRHLYLATPSIPRSAVSWLRNRTSLSTLHLVIHESFAIETISRIVPILTTLTLLRCLVVDTISWSGRPILPNSTLVHLLQRVPPWIARISLDVITEQGGPEHVKAFLETRRETALREFEIFFRRGERSVARKYKTSASDSQWFWTHLRAI